MDCCNMLGKKEATSKLFYEFSLEQRVPPGHFLRQVANTVDFSFVRKKTARFYSHTGQPSVDPEVLFKIALLGYLFGITSERRLVEEISLNLAYMWFIGYDLDEPIPNHSVLSKARKRFGPTLYLSFFTEIVRQCKEAGLIVGDKLYADSTLVEASASADSIGSRALVTQLSDVASHVEQVWQDNAMEDDESDDGNGKPPALHPLPELQVSIEATVRSATETAAESVAESTPDVSLADTTEEESVKAASVLPTLHLAGEGDIPNKALGLFNERLVSRVDPDAEFVEKAHVRHGLCYKVHVGVDGGRKRIITAVEVTGGSIADEHLLERIIQEHEGNVERELREVVADAKYGTADNYRMLERRQVKGSIPMRTSTAELREVPARAFVYDENEDIFVCPNGEHMKRHGRTSTKAGEKLIVYRTQASQCAGCELKAKCCGEEKTRSVSRPDDDGLRERTRRYLATAEARPSIRRRQVWPETVFGDGKERRGLRRAKFRGLDWMRVQAWMIATAQNIRQLALSKVRRPMSGAAALVEQYQPELLTLPLSQRLADFHSQHILRAIMLPN
jgi:transposase